MMMMMTERLDSAAGALNEMHCPLRWSIQKVIVRGIPRNWSSVAVRVTASLDMLVLGLSSTDDLPRRRWPFLSWRNA